MFSSLLVNEVRGHLESSAVTVGNYQAVLLVLMYLTWISSLGAPAASSRVAHQTAESQEGEAVVEELRSLPCAVLTL